MASPVERQALETVPLFPLPSVVLFPGSVLPLHVFEPRYRDMMRDALAATRLLIAGRLKPGYEEDYEGRPPVYPVAGIGSIIESECLPDGRYALLLQGIARVRIEAELPPNHRYRQVRTCLLADEPPSRDPAPLRDELISVCEILCKRFGDPGTSLLARMRKATSAANVADLAASAFVSDPDRRQELLELLEPCARLARVRDHIGQLVIDVVQDPEHLN